MRRFATVIGIRPEKLARYRELHAAIWPEVAAALKRAHVSNYSIFLHGTLLFGYLEYQGTDWDADMAEVARDPATRRWWAETDPCQEPLPTRREGEWWAAMEEVFHLD